MKKVAKNDIYIVSTLTVGSIMPNTVQPYEKRETAVKVYEDLIEWRKRNSRYTFIKETEQDYSGYLGTWSTSSEMRTKIRWWIVHHHFANIN